jgi:WD40 repeat protein
MSVFREFASGSNSFLHDAAYDYYGRRLATASSDQRIAIFDREREAPAAAGGQAAGSSGGSGGHVWRKSGEISRAHGGSILKIDWAHPEFGALLASCSTDRTVQIYQELVDPRNTSWKKQARLVDSRDAVTVLSRSLSRSSREH